ncbi:MAG: collagen-binding domain-containing protein [Phycisphaerae bacterium]
MKKLLQSKKRGSAIPLAVVALLILLAMGSGLLSLGLNSRVFSIRKTSDIIARCAADAGLTMALFRMNEKLQTLPWDGSILPQAIDANLPNCDATYSYTVTGDLASGYTITSIGRAGQAQRTVSATLRLKGLFDNAIFVEETITMSQNNQVLGYNSATGETGLKVQIGTHSTAPESIIFGSGTIAGDVVVGVGGDPETVLKSGGTIKGITYALSEEYELPTITPPTLPDMGTIDVLSTTVLSPADSGRYTSITSLNGEILEISGGDVVLHVTGNINMDNFSEIRINDGSSLILYVDGNFTCINGAGINNPSGNCADFTLYATGTEPQVFELKNNSDVFGAVYAPNADIILKNNAVLHGSVTAKSFAIKNNGIFYYDAALSDVSIIDEGVRFVVKRWYEGGTKSSTLDVEPVQQ